MRKLLAPVLLLMSFAPSGAAASLSSELGADSPVDLFGEVRFGADGLRVFHLAPTDASLRGTIYNGTLFEHRRIVSTGCPGSPPPREQRSVAMDVRGGDLANLLRIELTKHGMVVFAPKATKDLTLADGSSTPASRPDSTPPLYLAPNNYVEARLENTSRPGLYPPEWTEAFSRHPFLLVPSARFDSTLAGLLTLESGSLRVARGDYTAIFTPRKETRDVDCEAPFSFTKGRETTTYSYQLLVETGTLAFDQAGVQNMLDYFASRRDLQPPATDGAPHAPPAGYWYQNRHEELSTAYAGLALPHTYFSAPRMPLAVEGAVRLKEAFGAITDNETISEIAHKDVVLSGDLVVTPVATAEQGRRMTSRIQGDLYVMDVALGGSSTDWTPWLAGAGAGIIGVGLVAFAWPGLKWKATQILLFPLYARLKKEDILENPLRDDILHVVQTTPGISASELGRRLECGWGTLVYHITVLERMGLVSSAREGRHKRFFAQGRINYSDKGAVGLLANPAARTILDAVREHPGIIQKDLSEQLGLAAGTIAWHIERLTQAGLVIKEEDGRVVRYFPSERLLELTKQLAA